jgi:predicted amidophosphoribosyltransferase
VSAAGGFQLVITCLVCEEKIQTWRGDICVECRSGAEYHARSGQLVEEPICGLLSWP